MRILLLLIITTFAALISSTPYAASYKCVGMDGTGEKINVIYDEDTNTINVNGTIVKIVSGTAGENGVASEDYKSEDGDKVYVSLVVEDKNKIILRQYSADNDEVMATVPLACE